MIKIETFYLIDYENVRGEGLIGCKDLGKTDHIVIFFTQNAKSIDMRDISNHGSAQLEMIEVPAGKQSADIHISSYIGYLIGKYDKNCKIVIVSKDTDFDNVIKFWKELSGITASRTLQIKKSNNTTTKTEPSTKKNTEINTEIQKAISKGGFTKDVANYVASTVVKSIGVKNYKQQIYRTIISKYGQEKGLNVYNHIKKLL